MFLVGVAPRILLVVQTRVFVDAKVWNLAFIIFSYSFLVTLREEVLRVSSVIRNTGIF